ncbi:tetratricopeptide repeat protein [Novosphingobium pokkalii]|uniref:Tetratricopeptide repeat protein n=1 Tax=Novosphingobium pokkalii TaxID=1770194 RepID=A0ABV7V594_9SPHN|nr:tetratricopeptide repeat protein [Novosphingobium pokkalii]GHC88756.1 hypothetical protein GCM10019060_11760 [Novosphingobium pokkalii]
MALRPNRPQNRSEQLAAARAAQGDVFAREVDDALRQDEAFHALRKWGIPVGAAVVLALAGLGGWLWYSNHQDTVRGRQGEQLTQALDYADAGNPKAEQALLDTLAKDGTPGNRAAAQLLQAGLAQEAGKADQAAKTFAAVAADSSAPQAYRDAATVREVALNFDKLPPQQVIDRLKPLAVPGNAWFGSAGELVGLAYLKQGHADLAGPLFAAIAKDKDVPDTIKRRARQVAGSLGVDAVDDVAAVVGQAQ